MADECDVETSRIEKLFEDKQKEIATMAKDIAEKEFEILELNLFISSAGKEHLQRAARDTEAIKKKIRQGKIDLAKYEKLAEGF